MSWPPKSHRPYPPEFRQRILDLVGRGARGRHPSWPAAAGCRKTTPGVTRSRPPNRSSRRPSRPRFKAGWRSACGPASRCGGSARPPPRPARGRAAPGSRASASTPTSPCRRAAGIASNTWSAISRARRWRWRGLRRAGWPTALPVPAAVERRLHGAALGSAGVAGTLGRPGAPVAPAVARLPRRPRPARPLARGDRPDASPCRGEHGGGLAITAAVDLGPAAPARVRDRGPAL